MNPSTSPTPKRRTRKWRARVAIASLAAISLTWLMWSAWFHSRPAIWFQETAFSITSDHLGQMRYEVSRRERSLPVLCVIRALDYAGRVVGEVREEIGPLDPNKSARRTEVSTTSRAAFIRVSSCQAVNP